MFELREAMLRPETLFKVSTVSKPCGDFELNASNLAAFVLAAFSMMCVLRVKILMGEFRTAVKSYNPTMKYQVRVERAAQSGSLFLF